MDLNTHFERYGYIHIKNVLSRSEIDDLRAYAHELFDREQRLSNKHRVRCLCGDHALTDPKLYAVMFRDRIISALKEILEPNFTMIPDHLVSRNGYGFAENGGWHWDSSSEGKKTYLFDRNYRFVKCGLFLQDNTYEFGGGIDFAPGAHRWPLRTKNTNLNFRAKYIADEYAKRLFAKPAPIEAGDFLAFASCLPHKSTLPHGLDHLITPEDRRAGHIANMPKEHAKIIFYWDACRTAYADAFFENNAGRAIREELNNPECDQWFYSYFTARRFPDDYDSGFVEQVRRASIRVPSLVTERLAEIRRLAEARGISQILPSKAPL